MHPMSEYVERARPGLTPEEDYWLDALWESHTLRDTARVIERRATKGEPPSDVERDILWAWIVLGGDEVNIKRNPARHS